MAMNWVQFGDGSTALQNSADGVSDLHVGGPSNPNGATPRAIVPRVLKMNLGGSNGAAGIVSFQNTAVYPLMLDELIVDVVTAATGACAIQAGTASTNVASTNMIASQDIHTAAGLFTGTGPIKLAPGSFFTISTLTGSLTGMVGYAYLKVWPATT